MNTCRICGGSAISLGKRFKPYSDFETILYDCANCGCRFTNRDEFIYEQLHSTESFYSAHQDLGKNAKAYFDQNELGLLSKYLRKTEKNRFILDHLDNAQNCNRVLEFGCSRGYLSSYAILLGKEFYGIDVSETAIAAAHANFGDHFHLESIVSTFPPGYFDFIYHVGTIGCVNDPIGFVENQIKLLRRGGTLLFNAPNLDVCRLLNLQWLTSTPPPDLVTLFPSEFWIQQFSHWAHVKVEITFDSPLVSYKRKRHAGIDFSSRKIRLFKAGATPLSPNPMKRSIRHAIKTLGRLLPPAGPFTPLPKEFGVYVQIRAR